MSRLDDARASAGIFIEATLCFLVDGRRILLAMKKRGFGKGKWNGVGGKLEKGETPYDAMVRETSEEIGVTVRSARLVGNLIFYNYDGSGRKDANMRVHVYIADAWDGAPAESEEMAPQWFDWSAMPYSKMWSDDKYWLQKAIEGASLDFEALFAEGGEHILEHKLTVH